MRRTIIEAIKEVMRQASRPMTVREIYEAIVSADLYSFKADQPLHVVASQIRRHCKGRDFPSASETKHFELFQNGKYYFLPEPIIQRSRPIPSRNATDRKISLVDLRQLHGLYTNEFRNRVVVQLKRLEPSVFEIFCKNLLKAYGFRDVVVTRISRDGGIDGHGRLKVGFTYFNVAFQCKRWTKRPIGRPEIDQFRGAIQGQFEQGIFFTTASFSPDAEKSSFKAGAVPIVLINGTTIVDIMLENNFGVETDSLPVYSLALDSALSE